ncbi:type II secretion system protein GspC [Leucothrix sargassi]|nr:type II secretion system protein GspC [Leucothrix sargassi]
MSDAQKWLQKVPGLLTFFLVIALGITLANLLWLVLTPASAVAEAAVLSSAPKVINKPVQNYGKLIADQHVFGAIPKQAPKAAPVKRELPKRAAPAPVKLNLKLHGIVASSTNGDGFAMISYNGKTQESYKRGEALPKKEADKERPLNGVVLKFVRSDSVIIDNNGEEQELTLTELASLTGNSASSSRSSTATPTRTPARQTRPSRATNNAASNGNGNGGDNSGIETLAELREALLEDSQIISTVITPSLVRKDGQVVGLRVYPSSNRPMFRALGFRNGDIIKQINGVTIDGSPSNFELLQQFADSPSLEITVERGGNEQILTPSF